MFQLRDNCHVGSKVKLPRKADTILLSSNSILKYPVLYISFYITCMNYFMSLYRTTSSWSDPLKGTFSFPVCAFDKGNAELWG